MSETPKIKVMGRPITNDDLELATEVLYAYADYLKRTEPHAVETIATLRDAALTLPSDVTDL
jgi:hypothetical protein